MQVHLISLYLLHAVLVGSKHTGFIQVPIHLYTKVAITGRNVTKQNRQGTAMRWDHNTQSQSRTLKLTCSIKVAVPGVFR